MSDTVEKVQKLSAGWRNYVQSLLSLDKEHFQLAQGGLGLQTSDSSGLFRIQDAVPAPTAVGSYEPDLILSRASAYLNLLTALVPETNPDAVRDALGDMYANWVAYKTNADNWPKDATIASVYEAWANRSSVDAGRAQRGRIAFASVANAPLLKAFNAYNDPANQQTFIDSSGSKYSLYSYSGTSEGALASINAGAGPYSIDFSSDAMDTATTSTLLKGTSNVEHGFFTAGAEGSFKDENAKAVGSSLVVQGTINKVATLLCGPRGWFSSGEYARALNASGDSSVWEPQAASGGWNSFFGQPNGSMARYVSGLVLVSDYTINVTSKASYSDSEYRKIAGSANLKVWPFFSAQASGSHTTSVVHNRDSTLTVTMTLGKGLIQILGAIVESAKK